MKSIPLLACVLTLTMVTAAAGETLFEDTFGQSLERSKESRGKFNAGSEQRQSGPLAPTEYALNGEGWQGQTHFNPTDGVVCRLLTRQPWLLATPAWELQSDDGNYEITFEFGFPTEGATPVGVRDEQPRTPVPPAETLLTIGQEMPAVADTKPPDQGIALIHRSGAGLPSVLMIRGKRAGEFSPGPPDELQHVMKFRWQQAGGVVQDLEAELNGQTIQADGGFTLPARKLMIGARGRQANTEPLSIGCLNLLSLQYSKK